MKTEKQQSAGNVTVAQREEQLAKQYAARKRSKIIRNTALLLVFAFLLYILIQLFVVMAPNVQKQVAILETMTDSITVDGVVTLNSTPVNGSGGIVYYTVKAGERVSVNENVAALFSTEQAAQAQQNLDRVNGELQQLESAKKALRESSDVELLLKQRQAGLYDLLDAMQTKAYAKAEEPKAEMTAITNKLQVATGEEISFDDRIATLQEQKTGLEEAAQPTGTIASPKTGFFVPSERSDRIITDYETASGATVQELRALLQQTPQVYPEDVIGHVVDDYKWNFFTVVDAVQAERFKQGQKLQIAFPDVSEDRLPIYVEKITYDDTKEYAKIEFICDNINETVLKLRTETAQIIFSTQAGIRIDKKALRVIDGVEGVYVLKPGNVVAFKKIDILFEDDFYYLIPKTASEENEVELYDEVIVDAGGVELSDGKIL